MKIHSELTKLFVGTMLLASACTTPQQEKPAPKAQNIILLIGDGMGVSQVSSSYYNKEGEPNFSRFENIGFIKTSSSSHKITDSAAGATAFASGKKSYNGAIGVDPDTVSIPTILEMAVGKDMATGVISTSSITHATPASFYSHVASRGMAEDIAKQLVTANVDFFAGGGLNYFINREDSINYFEQLVADGVKMDSVTLGSEADLCEGCKYGYLMANDGMPRMLDGRGAFLPEATSLGLAHLSKNNNGFFLMIEGSQIDWGGHANDADYIVTEVLDFDKAIGAALDFAEKDGNTLVIVTADHETGGYTLASTPTEDGWSDYDKITGTFSTGGHSATLIPVFAYGPGADQFRGIYENTKIFDKMLKSFDWK